MLEGFQWCALTIVQRRDGVFQAVINMILYQRALGLAHRFFNRMQLLGDVHALTALFDHGDDAAQVAVRALEALDDRCMALVGMGMFVVVLTQGLSLGFQ